MSFSKKYIDKQKEKEKAKTTERREWLYSLVDQIEAGVPIVEASGLEEYEARLLERKGKKYGYKEDITSSKGFNITLRKTPLSELSKTLGIPQSDMTVIKVELTNMVQCEYCNTTYDLNQESRCPHCGGKSKTET